MQPTDLEADLVRRAVQGDGDALTRLLLRHGPGLRYPIRAQIPARLRPLLSEDDVLQESYAEAFLHIGRFDATGSFRAWISRIARNNLLDAIRGLDARRRDGKRRQGGGPDRGAPWPGPVDPLDDSATTPSRSAMGRELAEHLDRALDQLPVAYGDVVRLYDLDGLSAGEVAQALGCSPGAVFMRRARAHRMLGEILESFSIFA